MRVFDVTLKMRIDLDENQYEDLKYLSSAQIQELFYLEFASDSKNVTLDGAEYNIQTTEVEVTQVDI